MVGRGGGLRVIVKQTDEKQSFNTRRRWTPQREATQFKVNLQGELERFTPVRTELSEVSSYKDL